MSKIAELLESFGENGIWRTVILSDSQASSFKRFLAEEHIDYATRSVGKKTEFSLKGKPSEIVEDYLDSIIIYEETPSYKSLKDTIVDGVDKVFADHNLSKVEDSLLFVDKNENQLAVIINIPADFDFVAEMIKEITDYVRANNHYVVFEPFTITQWSAVIDK